jgi:hypothetical protein
MAKARRLVIACAHEAATGAPTDQNGVFRVERVSLDSHRCCCTPKFIITFSLMLFSLLSKLFALMPAVLGVSAPADYERQFCRAMATFDNSTTTTTTKS